jgi:hypothetical protein
VIAEKSGNPAEIEKTRQRQDAQRAEAEQVQTKVRAFGEKLDKFKQSHPEFDDIALTEPTDGGPVITRNMTMSILEDDNGPAIALFLGNNPKKAERIANLSPARQVYEMGRLSLKLEAMNRSKPVAVRKTETNFDDLDAAYQARRRRRTLLGAQRRLR